MKNQNRWWGMGLVMLWALVSATPTFAQGGKIVKKQFCYDGCSVSLSLVRPWEFTQCCAQHDLAYYIGGDYTERDRADSNLRDCVFETARRNGSSDVSGFYHAGVMDFGDAAWGSAWGETRATAWDFLDAAEKAQIDAMHLPHWTNATPLSEMEKYRCPTFSNKDEASEE